MDIAVIGSGISGLGAAWALSADHNVTLFEVSDRIGGHSRTLNVPSRDGVTSIDTGFIVYNERNYPHLTRLFKILGVDTAPSDMSLSVSMDDGSLEYAGRAGALFTRPGAVIDRRVWRVLRGMSQLRSERTRLRANRIPSDVTIGEYLSLRGYPSDFSDFYLMPLASAVWSGTRHDAASMPARTFLAFLDNHGLVDLRSRPAWRTVAGGSRRYVDRMAKEITRVHTSRGIRAITPIDRGVELTDVHGTVEVFDHVVVATHADVALRMLGANASPAHRSILGAFAYEANEVILHTDASVMPRSRRAWSSWNVMERTDDDGQQPVAVTYWMNRLQNLPKRRDFFVTLNPQGRVRDDHVLDVWAAMHPQFDLRTQKAQQAMPSIQGRDGIWFAGAHLGHGFHEDGLQSGLTVAAALGSPVPWWSVTVPASPAARHAAPAIDRVPR